MARSSFSPLAVIAGVAIDWGSTQIVFMGVVLAFSAMHWSLDRTSPEMSSASMILGTLCTVLGGFTAARFARNGRLVNPAAVGFVATLFSLAGYVLGEAPPLDLRGMVGIGIGIPAAVAGGWLGGARD